MGAEITLRGHHIVAFRNHILFKRLNLSIDSVDESDLKRGYSPEFLQNKQKIFDELYLNRDTKVRIVENSVDVLCIACSKPGCIIDPASDYDRLSAAQYGFEIGSTYPASVLIDDVAEAIDGLDNLILK